MTTPHADGPETDKAAWAGGDAQDVAAAQAVDDKTGAAPSEAVEGEIVEDDPAPTTDGAAGDRSSDDDATSALQAQLDARDKRERNEQAEEASRLELKQQQQQQARGMAEAAAALGE